MSDELTDLRRLYSERGERLAFYREQVDLRETRLQAVEAQLATLTAERDELRQQNAEKHANVKALEGEVARLNESCRVCEVDGRCGELRAEVARLTEALHNASLACNSNGELSTDLQRRLAGALAEAERLRAAWQMSGDEAKRLRGILDRCHLSADDAACGGQHFGTVAWREIGGDVVALPEEAAMRAAHYQEVSHG